MHIFVLYLCNFGQDGISGFKRRFLTKLGAPKRAIPTPESNINYEMGRISEPQLNDYLSGSSLKDSSYKETS